MSNITDKHTAILLVNLGTPKSAQLKDVRQFLAEFLMDPRVVNLPWILRAILVYAFIVPFRSKSTQKAYQEIWRESMDNPLGSPLLLYSKKLLEKLSAHFQEKYPNQYTVTLAMRYAGTALNYERVLDDILANKKITKLIVLPLYPQYAVSTSMSSTEAVFNKIAKQKYSAITELKIINDFYEHPGFIKPQAHIARAILVLKKPDYVLFSFHGLPQKQIQDTGCGNCDSALACPVITETNRFCYRAQCFASARALADALSLAPDKYGVAFQSRLGRLPWIGPYTDEKIKLLAQQGVKHLAVMCPSFVADCLETLEEIQLRLKKSWFSLVSQEAGGMFSFVPCVNDHPQWIAGIDTIIHTQ